MCGKTIVITGATSGIGEVAAIRLAERGARIVFTARDQIRAAATMEKLRRANGAVEHAAHLADLSLLAEMKRVAGEIAEEPQIDVLINNAGAVFGTRQETRDGLERTFALNHMSYFVITNMLLPRLKPGARIVSTASGAHRRAVLDLDDPQSRRGYSGFPVYARSKLCNILFTRQLARRIAGSGVTANCLHPGFVATRFGDQSGGLLAIGVWAAKRLTAISEEDGAKTLVYLAASENVAQVNGAYFYECKIDMPSPAARDDRAAKRLWDISAEISGVGQ
ncbi:MAG: SDR family oxidoreductase [Alphaproteobacteria bacterium]|nr:SDR family oxidoreductase [Alphaproteobacteria bacterium]